MAQASVSIKVLGYVAIWLHRVVDRNFQGWVTRRIRIIRRMIFNPYLNVLNKLGRIIRLQSLPSLPFFPPQQRPFSELPVLLYNI
jgi:hypothetical protein